MVGVVFKERRMVQSIHCHRLINWVNATVSIEAGAMLMSGSNNNLLYLYLSLYKFNFKFIIFVGKISLVQGIL